MIGIIFNDSEYLVTTQSPSKTKEIINNILNGITPHITSGNEGILLQPSVGAMIADFNNRKLMLLGELHEKKHDIFIVNNITKNIFQSNTLVWETNQSGLITISECNETFEELLGNEKQYPSVGVIKRLKINIKKIGWEVKYYGNSFNAYVNFFIDIKKFKKDSNNWGEYVAKKLFNNISQGEFNTTDFNKQVLTEKRRRKLAHLTNSNIVVK